MANYYEPTQSQFLKNDFYLYFKPKVNEFLWSIWMYFIDSDLFHKNIKYVHSQPLCFVYLSVHDPFFEKQYLHLPLGSHLPFIGSRGDYPTITSLKVLLGKNSFILGWLRWKKQIWKCWNHLNTCGMGILWNKFNIKQGMPQMEWYMFLVGVLYTNCSLIFLGVW